MTKKINLNHGQVAIVDDWWYEDLNRFKWYALYSKKTRSFYARRAIRTPEGQKVIAMHRVIMNAPAGVDVDHINGDTLCNLESNLRFSYNGRNAQNAKKRIDNTSGYKGVSFYKPTNKWVVKIQKNKKRTHVGYFENIEDAARAYDDAAKQSYGDFARLNFPEVKHE